MHIHTLMIFGSFKANCELLLHFGVSLDGKINCPSNNLYKEESCVFLFVWFLNSCVMISNGPFLIWSFSAFKKMLQLSDMATVGARYVYMCVLGGLVYCCKK